jgi:hypothetical protein
MDTDTRPEYSVRLKYDHPTYWVVWRCKVRAVDHVAAIRKAEREVRRAPGLAEHRTVKPSVVVRVLG